MNVRVTTARCKDPEEVDAQSGLLNDLQGFVGFVPSIAMGESMIIMYRNAITIRHSSSPVQAYSYDERTGIFHIETVDRVYELLNLEHGLQRKKKRIVSTLYTESRIRHNPLRAEADPDGHLFADGCYKTKIFASDLPAHYVYGYLYKQHGFISASGVKHLLYVPNYIFNHRHKDDSLYISYDEPIRAVVDDLGLTLYEGCKHIIGGSLILDFVDAAEKYSGYDVSCIRAELQRKSDWYDATFGKKEE